MNLELQRSTTDEDDSWLPTGNKGADGRRQKAGKNRVSVVRPHQWLILPPAPAVCSCRLLLIGGDEIWGPLFQILKINSTAAGHQCICQLDRTQVHVSPRILKPLHALVCGCLIVRDDRLAY